MKVFLQVSNSSTLLGTIVIELFTSTVPKTCQNFHLFCTNPILNYRGTQFHRIVKDFMIQGGEIPSDEDPPFFDDENFELKHDQAMLVSMANCGPNTNYSQFFITSRATPHLDGLNVVFGRVVEGQDVVRAIEKMECDEEDVPVEKVWISDCGEVKIVEQRRDDNRLEVDAEIEDDQEEEVEDEESNPYVIGVAPPADTEASHRFLLDKVAVKGYKIPSRPADARDKAGRVIKGRGSLKYGADPESNDRKRPRNRDRHRSRSRERDTERGNGRENDGDKDRNKGRDRERDRDRDKGRDRDSRREDSRDHYRSKYR